MFYEVYLKKRQQENTLVSAAFEEYLEHIEMDKKTKCKLSNLKTEYGTKCQEQAFKAGFYAAVRVMRYLLIK